MRVCEEGMAGVKIGLCEGDGGDGLESLGDYQE